MEMFINILIGAGLLAFFGWLAWKILSRTFERSEDPGRLIANWVATITIIITWAFIIRGLLKAGGLALAFGGPILTAAFSIVIGIIWAPSWGRVLANPLASLYDGGTKTAEPAPFYAIAEAKRKRGLYDVSISEVRKQLAKFPNDLKGHLMLSELLSEHKDDVDGAIELLEQYFAESEPGPV